MTLRGGVAGSLVLPEGSLLADRELAWGGEERASHGEVAPPTVSQAPSGDTAVSVGGAKGKWVW